MVLVTLYLHLINNNYNSCDIMVLVNCELHVSFDNWKIIVFKCFFFLFFFWTFVIHYVQILATLGAFSCFFPYKQAFLAGNSKSYLAARWSLVFQNWIHWKTGLLGKSKKKKKLPMWPGPKSKFIVWPGPSRSARRPRTSRGQPKLGPYVSFPAVLIRRGRRKDVASTSHPNRTFDWCSTDAET